MSNAKPMDPDMRVLMYVEHVPAYGPTRWSTMTPRQRRRWTRKAHRYDGFTWPVTGKGRATPRQADVRAAMLARRRG